jgi:hypothetical protein
VALVDMGGDTTDLAIFEKAAGTPACSRWAASTSPTTWRWRRTRSTGGRSKEARLRPDSMVPDEDPSSAQRRRAQAPNHGPPGAGDVVQPARKRCQMVFNEIRRAASTARSTAGGPHRRGGILEGMPEIAEQVFDMPVRRGTPSGTAAWSTSWPAPCTPPRWGWFSTAIATGRDAASRPPGPRRRDLGKVTGVSWAGWISSEEATNGNQAGRPGLSPVPPARRKPRNGRARPAADVWARSSPRIARSHLSCSS